MTADVQPEDADLHAQMAEALRIETLCNAVISRDASAIRLSPEIRTAIVDKGEVCLRSSSVLLVGTEY